MANVVRIGEFGYLYRQVIKQMLRITLWFPLLVQGLLAVGLAFAHENVFSAIFGPILNHWVGFLYPDAAQAFFHYPDHYLILPMVFSGSAKILNVFTEAFLFAIFSDLLINLYRGQKPSFLQSFKSALRLYLKLWITWFVLLALLYFVSSYFYTFLEDVIGFSLHTAPKRQLLAFAMLHGLNVLFYMPFIYIIPSIVTGKTNWWPAIMKGVRLSFRHPLVTFGIVAIPYTIAAIPALPLSYTRKIITVFNPELVFQIMLIAIGVNIIANFVLMGTAVKFFLDKTE